MEAGSHQGLYTIKTEGSWLITLLANNGAGGDLRIVFLICSEPLMEYHDFVIIGAGLSGIDAAYRLKTTLPECSYIILEARQLIGGTWDFFNYPGIRSDSDLLLYGLPWRLWSGKKGIADGASIRQYLEDAAHSEGIDEKIRFRHKVTAANWSSDAQQWTLDVDASGAKKQFRAHWVISCAGFYDYDTPLQTEISGIDNFRGTVVHPQFWPSDLDWSGKRVIIIGSGATAVTLLPELAKTAGHITMLQRSPSYVFSIASTSSEPRLLKRFLPAWLVMQIRWWLAFITETLFVQFLLKFPNMGRKLVMDSMRKQVPAKFPVDVHFNPRYFPFEQRLCLCPDGDFFQALHQDNCNVVTSSIQTVTEDGIMTESGEKLGADIIITATGLHFLLFGGLIPTLDGKPVDIGRSFAWRGLMLSGVPNMCWILGYTTGSWTAGADATIKMLIRVYKHMRKVGATSAVPDHDEEDLALSKPLMAHSSTYHVKAQGRLPRVKRESPWYGRSNAVFDNLMLWFGSVTTKMTYIIPGKKSQ